jgi:peptidoglycan/xylan/chitin deacetylase (PgdA/CDA1 family)
MWTVLGRDWKWPGPQVAARLLAHASNGGILCLHDGRDIQPDPDIRATLEAVEQAIPRLQDRGFHFETVSQILCPTN